MVTITPRTAWFKNTLTKVSQLSNDAGYITASASITGNAATATKLATARTINGTSFNGTANITTANWGTARNIGIVNSDGTGTAVTTSVNGSANVNLKLPATIKASLTGNASSATKLQTARTIAGVSFDGTANIAIPFANLSSKPTTLEGYGITNAYTKAESDTNLTSAINAIVTAPRNYVISSRTDNLTGWTTINGTRSIVNDPKFGNVVQWERTSGSPADYQKQFTLVEKSSFEGGPITLFVIAKKVSTSGFFYFGWNGYATFIDPASSNTNQIDLGGGWFVFWRSIIGPASLTNSTYFGINTISGTWQFYAVGLNMANKYGGWQLAQEDMVTLNTAQTITGAKTLLLRFLGIKVLELITLM